MTITIGIDPGTRVTGFGIVRREGSLLVPLDFGTIRPPPTLPLPKRYLILFESVAELLKHHRPDNLAIETQFVRYNVSSAIKLAMARAAILVAAAQANIEIVEYSPTQAKKAVCKGNASKKQVQAMVKQLLNLKNLPAPEDAADALALAICHLQRENRCMIL